MEGQYPPYTIAYIDKVPDDSDITGVLESNMQTILDLVRSLPDEKLEYRYAPGKWSIKEVLVHITDTERIFAYRALRIARNDTTPLPGYDENAYIANADTNARSIDNILTEYEHVRKASIAMTESFTADATQRTGTSNNHTVSVSAVLYMIAGHELHHLQILRERYL